MDANSWALIPLIMVGLLFLVVGGGYTFHWLVILRGYLIRRRTLKLHLALNRAEIEVEVMWQKIRVGVTSERARALQRWIEHEEPRLKGWDRGIILPAQEALLRELAAE